MTSKLLIKRSEVPGQVPAAEQVSLGELAINTRDGKLYLKRDNGDGTFKIVEVGSPEAVAQSLQLSDLAYLGIEALDAKADAQRVVNAGAGLAGGGSLNADIALAADFATSAEAVAGTTSQKVMSPAGVEAHMNAHAHGVQQTWQAVSRTVNVVYQNDTPRPISVSFYYSSSLFAYLYVSPVSVPVGSTWLRDPNWVLAGLSRYGASCCVTVPPGHFYHFSGYLTAVSELR